jgi:MerR family transcriptional regulator/heat shock protein HspR
VFELEEQLEGMERKIKALEKRATELKAEVDRLERVRRELRAEIVPYVKGGAIVRNADLKRFTVRVQRPGDGAQPPGDGAQRPGA